MSRKAKRKWMLTGRMAFVIVWCLFTLIPIYTAFVASLTKYENLGKNFLWPADLYFRNYIDIWQRIDLLGYFKAVSYTHLDVYKRQVRKYPFDRDRMGTRRTCRRIYGKIYASFDLYGTDIDGGIQYLDDAFKV